MFRTNKEKMEVDKTMAESKYGHHVITEIRRHSPLSPERQGPNPSYIPPPGTGGRIQLLYLDDSMIKGAFYSECVWILPGGKLPGAAEPNSHAHDFDEIVTFIGNNVEDPYDLGGEIEFWLEDEPQILTKSCIIFLPKGMFHGPLIIRRVDRPIFHTAMGTGPIYQQYFKDQA
jgi:hypothetical protein